MMRGNRNRLMIAGIVVLAVALVGHLNAQIGVETPQNADSNDTTPVGTYSVQEAFAAHPASKKLDQALAEAQTGMEKAQQEGNQQQMQQIQQKYEQTRSQAVETFREDVAEALPEVAREAGVKVVALDIVYTAEGVRTKNLTPLLTEALPDGSDKDSGEQPRTPVPPVVPGQ